MSKKIFKLDRLEKAIITSIAITFTITLGTWMIVIPIREHLIMLLGGLGELVVIGVGLGLISLGIYLVIKFKLKRLV